jgi:prepilin-type N-terminal cleavage/methylation domain-containing protein
MTGKGFTLVEILVVVLVLSALAAIVLPQLSTSSNCAKANMLSANLQTLRNQIKLFTEQHGGIPPGYPCCDTEEAPTEAWLIDHLTKSCDAEGQAVQPGTPGCVYGPYIGKMVANPINCMAGVQVVSNDAEMPNVGDDSHGWIYQPATAVLKSDASGKDPAGKAYIDY